jgi:uncharacterized membrane protein
MPKLTYAENPVHPVLNDYPSALIPTSLVFDMLHLVTRRPTFRNAAFFTLLLAFVSGGAAAATGFQDYQEIPEGTEAKRMANAHAILNMGLLGAIAIQLLIRVTGRVGLFARVLNVAATAGVITSGWYGTHLVYRHGVRVHGVDPLAAAPDAVPDRGKPLADRLERLLQAVPDTDLTGYAVQAGDLATDAGTQARAALDSATREVGARVDEVRRQVEARSAPSEVDDEALVDVAAAVRHKLPDDTTR